MEDIYLSFELFLIYSPNFSAFFYEWQCTISYLEYIVHNIKMRNIMFEFIGGLVFSGN